MGYKMSFVLRQLSTDERKTLVKRLWDRQAGRCYISGKVIDLALHSGEIDVDHIIPTRDNGSDSEENWALTFNHYNRSKQASDLRVARILARMESIREDVTDIRGANLGHVLNDANGAKYSFPVEIAGSQLRYSLAAMGRTDPMSAPIWTDSLSGMKFSFLQLPIEYFHHDDRLNPRGIGSNIRGLIEEFFAKRPQLHVPLAWIDTSEAGDSKIKLFDGQHKAAAQILLGVRELPIRLFINPDTDILLTANTRAGTTLRQVAFDKSIQRQLGSRILLERIDRFRNERNLPEDYEGFNEQQIADHFKGEQASVRKYIIDAQRAAVTDSPENRLRDYIEFAGKSASKPFSYSAIEKAIYSQFISDEMLATPWNYKEEVGENPRALEREQLVRLLNIVADKLYIGQYNLEIGGAKLESRVQSNESVDDNHLRAHRMAREEILSAWIKRVVEVINLYFTNQGINFDMGRPFQRIIPEQAWTNVGNYISNIGQLPLWKDHALSATIYGGKRLQAYWTSILTTGNTPDGLSVVAPEGLSLIMLIRSPQSS